jgi:uncharacterized protein YdhG (YjbR/CyaY superfamily)
MARTKYATVDDYVADLPPESRAAMDELRATLRSLLPDAEEAISYQIASLKLNGRAVVWYAGFRDHVSLFPWSDRMRDQLGAQLQPYLAGKGTIRFRLGQPLPADLIRRIVEIRRAEALK